MASINTKIIKNIGIIVSYKFCQILYLLGLSRMADVFRPVPRKTHCPIQHVRFPLNIMFVSILKYCFSFALTL